MATWPTGDDTRTWMRSETIGVLGDDLAALDEVTESAVEMLRSRIDDTDMDDECPASVALAVKIRAASLYVRRQATHGVVSVNEDAVFRVSRFDSDVDQLLAPWRLGPNPECG